MDQDLKRPSVSVIMPVYNCELFVAAAIESILNQTHSDLELIIIDDCSTDNTRQVINGYSDERIVFVNKENKTGLVASLNTGIGMSKGEFLARMDGDDISHPARLEKQVSFLVANPDIAICGTWYQIVPSNEIVENPVENEDIKIGLLDFCALGHPTVMFRKFFFTINQLTYDAQFFPAEDYDLWTRITAIGKTANLPEVLLFYRVHEHQVSGKEQSAQVMKSFACKRRMMCYALIRPTGADIKMSSFLVENQKISEQVKLKEAVEWLDQLFDANKRSVFYDEQKFLRYITRKKSMIIRGFYLHTTSYSPSVWLAFLKSNEYYKHFTPIERIKFTLKCMLFLKVKLQRFL